jgi:hypothetical protein
MQGLEFSETQMVPAFNDIYYIWFSTFGNPKFQN